MISTRISDWEIAGKKVGSFYKAATLNKVRVLNDIDTVEGKLVGRLDKNETLIDGTKIGGFFYAKSVMLATGHAEHMTDKQLRRWLKRLNNKIAPSLQQVPTNKKGKSLKVISAGDIIKMLAEQKGMEELQKQEIEENAVRMEVSNNVGGAATVADAANPAEGVVGGAVEIVPIPGVPDNVGGAATVADAANPAEGDVSGAVEIAPIPDVPDDAVGDRGFANGTTSPLMMPPPVFPVASSTVVFRQNSMISKKLCEITQFPEFAVESTHTVHFRERDDKVSFPDLSVRMGVYKTISEGHRAILQLIEKKDSMVNDLDSIEVDDKLLIMTGKSVILMSFPDAIKLLHRLDVRTSDAVQDVIMAQTEVTVDSEAAQDVIMAQTEVAVASEAAQDIIMAQDGVPAATEAVQDVIQPHIKATAAFDAARPVAVIIRMRKVPASVLKTISGFENLDDFCLKGREVRQVEPDQVDEKGEDIGGKWIITDGVSACTGDRAETCVRWVKNPKNVNKEIAKSLTYIDSGNNAGGKLALVDSSDFVNILMGHAKMSSLRHAAGNTHVEVNSGGADVIARAVEAAQNPTEGQCMLQTGFDGAILGGESREKTSTTTNADGIVRVDRVVERSAISENGQEILVQQVKQSVDIEMAIKAELAAQMPNIVTKAEFNDEIKGWQHALVTNSTMIVDNMVGCFKYKVTELKGYADAQDAKLVVRMDNKMVQEEERVDKNMTDLRKAMDKKIKANNKQRDAKDTKRDAKDAQRDALIVSLQGELYNVRKRAADMTQEDSAAPKMQRRDPTKPTNITNNGGSKPWGYKKTIDKTLYIKSGFYTMAEAVTALDIVLKKRP